MRTLSSSRLCLATCAILVWGGWTLPPSSSPRAEAVETADDSKQRGRRSSGAIDPAELIDIVDELGYDYELFEGSNGDEYPQIQHEQQEGWFFPINLSLSGDGTILWISQPLQAIPDRTDETEIFQGLLEANSVYGPPMFSYVADTRMIWINQAVPNRGLDADVIEETVKAFGNVVEQTLNLWAFDLDAEPEDEDARERDRGRDRDEEEDDWEEEEEEEEVGRRSRRSAAEDSLFD